MESSSSPGFPHVICHIANTSRFCKVNLNRQMFLKCRPAFLLPCVFLQFQKMQNTFPQSPRKQNLPLWSFVFLIPVVAPVACCVVLCLCEPVWGAHISCWWSYASAPFIQPCIFFTAGIALLLISIWNCAILFSLCHPPSSTSYVQAPWWSRPVWYRRGPTTGRGGVLICSMSAASRHHRSSSCPAGCCCRLITCFTLRGGAWSLVIVEQWWK